MRQVMLKADTPDAVAETVVKAVTAANTVWLARANVTAVARPIPLLDPVTTTVLIRFYPSKCGVIIDGK